MNTYVKLQRLSGRMQSLSGMRFFRMASSITTKNGVKWLFPAGSAVKKMDEYHQKGLRHYPICVTLSTSKPLKTEDFEKALDYLYNKMPPLRTCFRYRKQELWVCEMASKKIDFKEVTGDDTLEQAEALNQCLFTNSAEGPLWRVRLMRGVHKTLRNDITPGYPHRCTILISFHHGMADGNCGIIATETLLEILENIIAGSPVNSKDQIGDFVNEYQTLLIKEEIRKYFETHPDEIEHFLQGHPRPEFSPLIYEAFGYPRDSHPTTRHLLSSLETSTLRQFRDKCKNAGVSMNSGFILAINTALVEVAIEAGVDKGMFHVTSRQAVNLRRYWKNKKSYSFGSHIGKLLLTIQTPRYDKSIFWEYARQIELKVRNHLQNKHMLKEEVVQELKGIKEPQVEQGMPVPIQCDYYVSHVTSGSKVWDSLKHLRIDHVFAFPNMHLCSFSAMHILNSLGGQMNYTVSYSSYYHTEKDAKTIVDKVDYIIRDIAS